MSATPELWHECFPYRLPDRSGRFSRLTWKCAAGGAGVQCGTALPACPHHCQVRALPITHLQWAVRSVVRSHSVPFQLLIYPFSPHSGHHHTIRSVAGSKSVSIIPGHGLRPGRHRHFTPCSQYWSVRKAVASATIVAMYSARRCAERGIGAIAPFSVNQCVRSTTNVFALRVRRFFFDNTSTSECRERPNRLLKLEANLIQAGVTASKSALQATISFAEWQDGSPCGAISHSRFKSQQPANDRDERSGTMPPPRPDAPREPPCASPRSKASRSRLGSPGIGFGKPGARQQGRSWIRSLLPRNAIDSPTGRQMNQNDIVTSMPFTGGFSWRC